MQKSVENCSTIEYCDSPVDAAKQIEFAAFWVQLRCRGSVEMQFSTTFASETRLKEI
jgi:hypothetical protein